MASILRNLLASAALFGLSAAQAQPTVITNVQGYTPVASGNVQPVPWQSFQTLVFEHGKVIATGDKDLVKHFPGAKLIDGKGRTLLPGLIDAHGHVQGLGNGKLMVDVRNTVSASDAAKLVQQYAKENPQLTWIKGRGWNQVQWPGKQFPDKHQLDERITDKPVWLVRVDGHAGWANQKALDVAGINRNTLDPKGGRIVKDANGEPTGILIDNAMDLLYEKMPKPTRAERQLALELAMEHLLSIGLTSVHDAGISKPVYQLYRDNATQGQLKVRFYPMVSAFDPDFIGMLEQGVVNDANDMLSIRSVKLSIDGALGSRGAALLEPYSDKPGQTGLILSDREKSALIYQQTLKRGFQLNVHAIGDKGNRMVLDLFEQSYKTVGGKHLRNRIEHAQVVALEDIPRFNILAIIPSMQPVHATSDMNMAEDRVGAKRLKGAYAWQRFLQQGSRIAGGSDFPVELANPFHGIHAAVTRQNHDNQPAKGWIPEQAMSVAQALTSFTIDAAWAAHQDDVIGSLEPGKWADFILIDRDVFTVPGEQLWQTKVLQTWVAGKNRYKAQ